MILPITINDLSIRKKYNSKEVEQVLLNCHIGHRKLLCVTIEFLTKCQENKINPDECFVIYIGSAPGIHLNIIAELYPNTKWLLYDKNSFVISNNSDKFILKNKYFFDENIGEANNLFKKSKKKYFLFMSDLRINSDDGSVIKDMLMQESWLLKMQCDASCLKFRLPYVNFIPNNKFEYIDGNIHIQTYAPKRSTETRLISFKPYVKKMYDINEYEEKLCYFNTVLRAKKFQYKNSNNYLFYNQYDDVREYQILYDCGKKPIYELYSYINAIYNNYKISNGIDCKLKMFIRRIKNVENNEKIIDDIQTIIFQINKLIVNKKKKLYKNLKITIDNYYIKKKGKYLYIDYNNLKK